MSKEPNKIEKEEELLSKVMHYYIDENIFYSVENKDHKLWIKQFREKYKKISK